MKLYGSAFFGATFKVRVVLSELREPHDFVAINPRQGEQKSPAFLAMNPNGKIPVLEDDGFFVWESNAILCYLAAKKPERGLLPLDPRGLAEVQQWLQWQATTLGPSTGEVMMETVYTRFTGRPKDEAKYAAGLEKLRRDLAVLEGALAGREYLCGRLTVADFSLVSGLHLRTVMGVALEPFPQVAAWVARLEARESIRQNLPTP